MQVILLAALLASVHFTQVVANHDSDTHHDSNRNSSIPVSTIQIRGLPSGSSDSCPSDNQRETIRAQSKQEILRILSDRIVPNNCEVGGKKDNPANSCSKIPHECSSGWYWIRSHSTGDEDVVRVYCELSNKCGCNITDDQQGWMRVAYLDMTDSDQQCPEGLRLMNGPKRTCRKALGSFRVSILYPTHGLNYTRVCGRIKAYQLGGTDAFHYSLTQDEISIDDKYVDGISVTIGDPTNREHIWTFAAGYREITSTSDRRACPCKNTRLTTPFFVQNDYFCETAAEITPDTGELLTEDPLWDGQGCSQGNQCCSFNNPPWFCKQLPESSTEDIEIRILTAVRHTQLEGEDTPIELIEIFVR